MSEVKKKALITGINGQDGSYLAEYLLELDYEVHGTIRRNSFNNHGPNLAAPWSRPKGYISNIKLHYAELTDLGSMMKIVDEVQPDEFYNLGAQSHVGHSFKVPDYTWNVNYFGPASILDYINALPKKIKYYQASTSEMFGDVLEVPQKETTKFNPQSPYAEAKMSMHQLVMTNKKLGYWNCAGILFNHESPRRGADFVTKKIVNGFRELAYSGNNTTIKLGNIDAKRDWGHAKDYVRAMHMIMNADEPDEWVVSMGEQHSVREFVEIVGKQFGYDNIRWMGKGLEEIGISGNQIVVEIDPQFYRPSDVNTLLGDSTKIREQLGWKPEFTFETLVKDMCK